MCIRDRYGWVDTGSSFLPSELIAAFLYAQLEELEKIQEKRKKIWNIYKEELSSLQVQGKLKLPIVPEYATNNAHMFYVLTDDVAQRDQLLSFLKKNGVLAVFHYLSLHQSEFYIKDNESPSLPNSDYYTNCLIRLPLYYELKEDQVCFITETIKTFYA